MDIDSIGQLFIYFQSIVTQNTPGGQKEFLHSPWEIVGHPSVAMQKIVVQLHNQKIRDT